MEVAALMRSTRADAGLSLRALAEAAEAADVAVSTIHRIERGDIHPSVDTPQRVVLLVADTDVRVVTEDGELLRHLTIDPTRDYQPRGKT